MGKDSQNLNHLNIYSYPEDIAKTKTESIIQKIIQGHDKGESLEGCTANTLKKNPSFRISNPIPQVIDNQGVYTMCINSHYLIGLIFEKEDNPCDYKEIFEVLADELLNAEKCCSFEDDIDIENFLITLFIDIRRYGDEILENIPMPIPSTGIISKVFLCGLDDVGKSSLLRRIKTGLYNDNYFTPTRNFDIEYIQRDSGNLAFWDIPGQMGFREKWLEGIQESNILIYMIDIANQLRFEESKIEFWNIINNYDFIDTPVLILGNKTDLIDPTNNASKQLERTKLEIIDFFEFDKLGDFNWSFMFTSVKTNYNIENVLNEIFNLTSTL